MQHTVKPHPPEYGAMSAFPGSNIWCVHLYAAVKRKKKANLLTKLQPISNN